MNKLAFLPVALAQDEKLPLPKGFNEGKFNNAHGQSLHYWYSHQECNKKSIFFFHGNWGNLSVRCDELQRLSQLGYSLFALDYQGFGKSTGKPSEENIIADSEAFIQHIFELYGFNFETSVLLGRSIGSYVAASLAAKYCFAKLVLVTPISSGKEQLKTTKLKFLSVLIGEPFNNKLVVSKVKCPVQIIYGDQDSITPPFMAKNLEALCEKCKDIQEISGAEHNNIEREFQDEFYQALVNFLNK